MKNAIETLASISKYIFDKEDVKIANYSSSYVADTAAWKLEQDAALTKYSQAYNAEMEINYVNEANAIIDYENTVTSGVNNLLDNPDSVTDLAGIAAKLASDIDDINDAVSGSIAAEYSARQTFITEFGNLNEFNIGIDHTYTVGGI